MLEYLMTKAVEGAFLMKYPVKNVEEAETSNVSDPIEKCVICGANTPYRFRTPINRREFYVEGSGQICQRCHYEIYIKESR